MKSQLVYRIFGVWECELASIILSLHLGYHLNMAMDKLDHFICIFNHGAFFMISKPIFLNLFDTHRLLRHTCYIFLRTTLHLLRQIFML